MLSRLIVTTLLLREDVRPVPPSICTLESASTTELLSLNVDNLIVRDSPPVIVSTYALVAASWAEVGLATLPILELPTLTIPLPLGDKIISPSVLVEIISLPFYPFLIVGD